MSRQATAERPQEQQQIGPQGRGAAEWITLAISVAVILTLLGLVTMLSLRGRGDEVLLAIEPELGAARQEGEAYYLPVMVRNDGGRTAEDVQVEVTLASPSGDEEAIPFTIRFLDSGEEVRAIVVLRNDPRQGEVTYVVSFLQP